MNPNSIVLVDAAATWDDIVPTLRPSWATDSIDGDGEVFWLRQLGPSSKWAELKVSRFDCVLEDDQVAIGDTKIVLLSNGPREVIELTIDVACQLSAEYAEILRAVLAEPQLPARIEAQSAPTVPDPGTEITPPPCTPWCTQAHQLGGWDYVHPGELTKTCPVEIPLSVPIENGSVRVVRYAANLDGEENLEPATVEADIPPMTDLTDVQALALGVALTRAGRIAAASNGTVLADPGEGLHTWRETFVAASMADLDGVVLEEAVRPRQPDWAAGLPCPWESVGAILTPATDGLVQGAMLTVFTGQDRSQECLSVVNAADAIDVWSEGRDWPAWHLSVRDGDLTIGVFRNDLQQRTREGWRP